MPPGKKAKQAIHKANQAKKEGSKNNKNAKKKHHHSKTKVTAKHTTAGGGGGGRGKANKSSSSSGPDSEARQKSYEHHEHGRNVLPQFRDFHVPKTKPASADDLLGEALLGEAVAAAHKKPHPRHSQHSNQPHRGPDAPGEHARPGGGTAAATAAH